MTGLGALLRRELSIAWSRGGGPVLALAFFAAVVALLALAVGGPPEKLAALAGGCAWLALALSSLLSLERLFERDFEDGALDLLADLGLQVRVAGVQQHRGGVAHQAP